MEADIEGKLNIWDLKEKVSTDINTNRTCISKIRFSPGKGNLKLLILFVDGGVDLYDLKQVGISAYINLNLCEFRPSYRVILSQIPSERIAQLKYPKDVKILDIDWAAQNTPILVTEDGCILITDIHFQKFYSPLTEYYFESKINVDTQKIKPTEPSRLHSSPFASKKC